MQSARHWLLAAVLLIVAAPVVAIVTVGPKTSNQPYTGCQFQTVQDAINYVQNNEKLYSPYPGYPDGADVYIGIAGAGDVTSDVFNGHWPGVYYEKLVMSDSGISWPVNPPGYQGLRIQLYGGYDVNCSDTPNGSYTEINAGNNSGNSVLEVSGNSFVYLLNLTMSGAIGVDYGGGINFHGSGLLDITNVRISGNHAHFGAGINVHGEGAGLTVNLHSANIENNTAATSSGFASGGGLYFNGHGELNAENTVIDVNQADFGGGIAVDPDGSTDVSFDNGGVWLLSNTANISGGGIFIKGPTNFFADAEASSGSNLIGLNKAPGGYGGGIFALGPAYAVLSPNIFANSASYGGGIALVGGSSNSENVKVILQTLDPNAPVNVSGNTASTKGGGIYVRPSSACCFFDNYVSNATFEASEFRFDGNNAPDGAAIYADSSEYTSDFFIASTVHLNERASGARPVCTPGIECNEINGNTAQTVGGTPTNGATITLGKNSTLSADRVRLQKNTGGSVVRDGGHDGNNTKGFNTDIGNCLITDNQVSSELLHLDNPLELDNCTLANNTIGAQHVIRASADVVAVTNTIIDQDTDAFDSGGNGSATSPGRTFQFLLVNHFDPTLPTNPSIIGGTPHFVDADNRNYHLLPDSAGLDSAPADSRTIDLDGRTRDVDLPTVLNTLLGSNGFRDIGAYELQLSDLPPPPPPPTCVQSDTIFCNGFE